MARMTTEEASRLHSVLDKAIGVFRDDDMPEKFLSFYNDKKKRFVETFSEEIPEEYWFHGGEFRSMNLNHSPDNGFYIESLIDVEGHLKPVLDQTNRKLHEAEFSVIP